MVTKMESGTFAYEVAEGWGDLPAGWSFKDVAGVGVDSQDRVYAFNRGKHPMIVFDRNGEFLRSWGEGLFKRAHGITMGPDDTIYCTDDDDHTVRNLQRLKLGEGVGPKLHLDHPDPTSVRPEVRLGLEALDCSQLVQRPDLNPRDLVILVVFGLCKAAARGDSQREGDKGESVACDSRHRDASLFLRMRPGLTRACSRHGSSIIL